MANVAERIDRLKGKLQHLDKIDRHQRVFGATGHRYKAKRWTVQDVEKLTQKIGIDLPNELQLWLLKVGGGPGPNYGLVAHPSEFMGCEPSDRDLQGDFDQLTDVRLVDLQALIDKSLSQGPDTEGYYKVPAITTRREHGGTGLLSLGYAGCSYDYVMPLLGELRGKIFYRTDEAIDEDGIEYGSVLWPQGFGRIYPSDMFRNARPTYQSKASDMFGFLDWMEDWLDSSIYFIENYQEYERQLNDWREAHLGWRDKNPGPLKRLIISFFRRR